MRRSIPPPAIRSGRLRPANAWRCAAIVAVVLCAHIGPAQAQIPLPGLLPGRDAQGSPGAPADSLAPRRLQTGLDEARADSPRGAVVGYLAASRAGNYERAAQYLDQSELTMEERSERGALLARQLKFVLDRKLWIDTEAVSGHPQGTLDDGLPEDRERIGTLMTRRGPVEIRLRRGVDEANGTPVWRFSPRLVERIPELDQEFGPGRIGKLMPPALYRPRFLEIELWQWIGLVAAAALAYGFALLFTRAFFWLLQRRAALRKRALDQRLLDTVRIQVRLAAALAVFLPLALLSLRLSIPARSVLLGIAEIIIVLLVTWVFIKLADTLWSRLRERLQREERRSAVALAVLGGRLTKAALAALGGIVVLQQVGFNATGILAGLGVGGVAVALAAQKTIANLFGGFSLATDQPVRIGDFCRFGDKSGWVEDVGIRSTRVRTLDRSVITVPNAEFAEVQLENMSLRDRMRLNAVLGLRYETTPDQLRWVLAELRRLLENDPRVVRDPLRVRFVGFGAYSLDVEVTTYIATADFDQFLAIREELFLKMMDIIREGGTSFAFPSRTNYIVPDLGLDPDRTTRAEQQARSWAAERPEKPA